MMREIKDMADIFKSKVVHKVFTIIYTSPGITVQEITAKMKLPQSNISRALGILKKADIISIEFVDGKGVKKKCYAKIGKMLNKFVFAGNLDNETENIIDRVYSHPKIKEQIQATDLISIFSIVSLYGLQLVEQDDNFKKDLEVLGKKIEKFLKFSHFFWFNAFAKCR